MKSDNGRLHIAAAIACGFTVMWMVGLSDMGTAFNGPVGAPSPVMFQLAEGANIPASLVQKAIRAMPALNDELGGPVVFFFAVALLWLWLFAWVPYLRRRRTLPLIGIKLSIFWCAVVASICFYRLTDVDALRTFPSLISSSGLENAIVASNALSWHFTLLWALFLAGSASIAAMRVMKTQVIANTEAAAQQKQRERRTTRQERKQKRSKQKTATSR